MHACMHASVMTVKSPVLVYPKTKIHETGNITLDGPQVLFAPDVDFKSWANWGVTEFGPSYTTCHIGVCRERIYSVLMKNWGLDPEPIKNNDSLSVDFIKYCVRSQMRFL